MKFLILILTSLILISSGFSQKKGVQTPRCEQPFSYKFDEFEFTDLENVKEKLDLFGLQLKNLKARGIVIGYGGKMPEAFEGRSDAYEVGNYLINKFDFARFVTISYWTGGHREKPSIELFIKPQSCSAEPEASPSLEPDEVTYKEEETFFSKEIVLKSSIELEHSLTIKIEPVYPAAAQALNISGKVLLLIIVDEKGNVINTTPMDGDPLLLAASEAAVMKWKYQIHKQNNRAVKFGGKVTIDWNKIPRRTIELSG